MLLEITYGKDKIITPQLYSVPLTIMQKEEFGGS
jgi:hypothetical protein